MVAGGDRRAGGDGPRRTERAVAAAALFLILYPLRYILLPFAVAAGAAFAVFPAVRWLERRLRFPRPAAAAAVFTPTTAACGALVYWMGMTLARQAGSLAAAAPQLLARLLQATLGGDPAASEATGRRIWDGLTQSLTQSSDAAGLIGAALAIGMGGVMTAVLYFYFLYDGDRLARGALALVPPAWRGPAREAGGRFRPALRRYLLSLVVVVTFTAAISWLWIALVLGIPHAELLAVATGLLELVPVIGPVASAALVSGAAMQRGGAAMLFAFLVFYIVLRLAIDQGLGALVFGRAMRLHPVTVLFALLAGGALYGPLGLLLAVPAAAALKMVLAAHYGDPEKPPP